jgi:hypothetical protein
MNVLLLIDLMRLGSFFHRFQVFIKTLSTQSILTCRGTGTARPYAARPSATMAAETLSDIGVFGMGVMGQNLCLNAADNGFVVSAYNRIKCVMTWR